MHLTRHRPSTSGPTEVQFPLLECWNPMTRVATIAAEVNKKRVLCRVSIEVLQKELRASAEKPMELVADNRAVLRDAARRLIESEAFEEDGSILIRREDLRKCLNGRRSRARA